MNMNPFEGLEKGAPIEGTPKIFNHLFRGTGETRIWFDGFLHYEYEPLKHYELIEMGTDFYTEAFIDILDLSPKDEQNKDEIIKEIRDNEHLSDEDKSDRIAQVNTRFEEESESQDKMTEEEEAELLKERDLKRRTLIYNRVKRIYYIDKKETHQVVQKEDGTNETVSQVTEEVIECPVTPQHILNMFDIPALTLFMTICGGDDSLDRFPGQPQLEAGEVH